MAKARSPSVTTSRLTCERSTGDAGRAAVVAGGVAAARLTVGGEAAVAGRAAGRQILRVAEAARRAAREHRAARRCAVALARRAAAGRGIDLVADRSARRRARHGLTAGVFGSAAADGEQGDEDEAQHAANVSNGRATRRRREVAVLSTTNDSFSRIAQPNRIDLRVLSSPSIISWMRVRTCSASLLTRMRSFAPSTPNSALK
jgi:hypothetical protein